MLEVQGSFHASRGFLVSPSSLSITLRNRSPLPPTLRPLPLRALPRVLPQTLPAMLSSGLRRRHHFGVGVEGSCSCDLHLVRTTCQSFSFLLFSAPPCAALCCCSVLFCSVLFWLVMCRSVLVCFVLVTRKHQRSTKNNKPF